MGLFDLMSAVTDYSILENRYGNFMVPAFKIKSSGVDLVSTLALTVTELRITLSLDSPGMTVFKIADEYDTESRSFTAAVKTKFKLGTVLTIEIGYLSDTTEVFKGFVAGLGAEFDDIPSLVVKVMDARQLMMSYGVQRVMYEEKNYSDVFKKVMTKYSKLCTVSCDPTSDNLESPISQSCNDYDFITKELIKKGKSEREFFIFDDKVYFRKPHTNKIPIMTVNYGRELLRFNMMADYINTKVYVLGYDSEKQKAVSSNTAAKTSEPMSSVITPAPNQYFIDADADSTSKASKRAGVIADAMVDEKCVSEGELIGIPEIIPGRYLKVGETDSISNRKYYLTEVVHYISGSEFTTRFESRGWC